MARGLRTGYDDGIACAFYGDAEDRAFALFSVNYLNSKACGKVSFTYNEWRGLYFSSSANCEICGGFFQNPADRHIDHDKHFTGKLLGLLCCHCNFIVMGAWDGLQRLSNAVRTELAEYINLPGSGVRCVKKTKAWQDKRNAATNCHLCGFEFNRLDENFKVIGCKEVDHNHLTGDMREVLCRPCNRRVGWMEKFNDIRLLCRVKAYVNKSTYK